MPAVLSQPIRFFAKVVRVVETVECALVIEPDEGLTNSLAKHMPWAIFNPT